MNNVMNVRRANESDSAFLAQVILMATRAHLKKGWFDILLNGDERKCLAFIERLTRTSARSWWHYAHFWIAEIDKIPVGALCCFRAGDGYSLSGDAFSEAAAQAGFSAAEQAQMWQRGSYIFECSVGGGDNLWTLENIATRPEFRRQGVTSKLIQTAITEGRSNHYKKMQVATFIGNTPAISAYEAMGFVPAEEKRNETFAAAVGAPGVIRLEFAL